jgi:hypothetical protein
MNKDLTAEKAIEYANAPTVRWYSSGCGRIELALALPDAESGYHSGQCDDDIVELMRVPYIAEQLAGIDARIAREVATEYGRNDYGQGPEGMEDRQANLAYILWMACGYIVERDQE